MKIKHNRFEIFFFQYSLSKYIHLRIDMVFERRPILALRVLCTFQGDDLHIMGFMGLIPHQREVRKINLSSPEPRKLI